MKKIILLTSVTAFSWVGWLLGEPFGMMTAYILSVVGSLVGVYIGVKTQRNYLE